MLSFHPIRGIVIKQWSASVIYFVGNFHHFVKKKKIKEYFVTNSFLKKIPITEKKFNILPEITTTDYTIVKVV